MVNQNHNLAGAPSSLAGGLAVSTVMLIGQKAEPYGTPQPVKVEPRAKERTDTERAET
jgi:hypothetical protein